MRKRVLLGVVLLICVAILTGLVRWKRPTPLPAVTPENFHRLHMGMSQGQVEAILGTPKFIDDEAVPNTRILIYEDEDLSANVHILIDGEGELPEGACYGVIWKHNAIVGTLSRKPPTFFERMRSLLPWHKPEE